MTPYRSEERIPYQTLKEWALNSYFDFCRDRVVVKGMSHFEVVGYVSYDFEYGVERQMVPIAASIQLLEKELEGVRSWTLADLLALMVSLAYQRNMELFTQVRIEHISCQLTQIKSEELNEQATA